MACPSGPFIIKRCDLTLRDMASSDSRLAVQMYTLVIAPVDSVVPKSINGVFTKTEGGQRSYPYNPAIGVF
jgi:hypothetical protein